MHIRNRRSFAAIVCGSFLALAITSASAAANETSASDHVVLGRQGGSFLLQNQAMSATWSSGDT